ncbi:MAG: hypothetical protein R3223_12320, partial [Longimicrobiales bacterium]|nr:hypothetical protein [Longimicrobiales bacterium]
NARAGDFHTFDFRRVRDRAALDLEVGERAAVTVGLDRYAKKGRSTASLSLQRDEFEVERPIDESSFETNVGFRYAWDRVTLSVEERYSEYENAYELFLPGRSTGVFPEDQTVVDFFFLDQPYAFTSRSHSVRVVATPLDRLTVRASGTLQGLDLDVEAREEAAGIGFTGAPFDTERVGQGAIERDLDLWDLDVTYLIGERWGLVAGSYLRSLDQEGELLFGGVPRRGQWDVQTRGFEGGVQWAPRRTIDLTVGLRRESRDVERGAVEDGPLTGLDETDTDQFGYFGTAAWKPSRELSFTLDWEDGSVDDPFTLASATDHGRLRASGRYTLDSGPWVSASYQRSRRENRNSGWEAEQDLATLRVGYRNDRLNTHAGYSRIDVDRRYDAEVEGTFGPPALFDVDYRMSSSFLDALIRFRAADDVWVGGQLRHYDNDGSFGLIRQDHRVFAEYRFPAGYLARVGLRVVDYDEAEFDFDDYDAAILDVGIGYTW